MSTVGDVNVHAEDGVTGAGAGSTMLVLVLVLVLGTGTTLKTRRTCASSLPRLTPSQPAS